MRRTAVVVCGVALFAAGFVCGQLDSAVPSTLNAQADEPAQLTPDALVAYQKARKAVSDLNDTFIAAGFQLPQLPTSIIFRSLWAELMRCVTGKRGVVLILNIRGFVCI